METTNFLVEIFGVLFCILGLSLMFNGDFFKKMLKEFSKSYSVVYISGIFTLVFGYYVVGNVNIIGSPAESIVGVLARIMSVKGAFLLLFPNTIQSMAQDIKGLLKILPIFGLLYLILGGYLLYSFYFI